MQQAAKKYFTPAEYLALEEAAPYKSEYYEGEIVQKASGSCDHNLIVGNLLEHLRPRLRKNNLEMFVLELKVWVEPVRWFTYPDLVVISGAPQFYENRKDVVMEPMLIVNVRRDPTRNDDRGERFTRHRTSMALQEYIMIDQYAVRVEQYSRQTPSRWRLIEHCSIDDILELSSVALQMSLRDIYDGVELTPPRKK